MVPSSSTSGALASDKILNLSATCLGDGEVNLKNPYEAVALVGHACMIAVDFRLIGLGEDHRIGLFPITGPGESFLQLTSSRNRI